MSILVLKSLFLLSSEFIPLFLKFNLKNPFLIPRNHTLVFAFEVKKAIAPPKKKKSQDTAPSWVRESDEERLTRVKESQSPNQSKMSSANNNAEIQALKTAHAEEINQLKDQITVLMGGMTSMNTRLALYESREEDREEHSQEEPPKTEKPPETPDLAAILAKFNTLEQSVQDKEKTTAIGVDMKKLNLFPEVKLPENFKYPDITKFDGTQDPRTHLMSYINAMSMKAVTEAGMAKLFPQSLIGQPLMWFLNLGDHDKASWDAIAKAFVNQYSHNFELEVTTQELESTRMSATESFADFVKRWRAKAAMVTPKLSDKEQIRVMSKCLPLTLPNTCCMQVPIPSFRFTISMAS